MSMDPTELTRAFEANEINPSVFRHSDHVAVAYEMLSKYDFAHAAARRIELSRDPRGLEIDKIEIAHISDLCCVNELGAVGRELKSRRANEAFRPKVRAKLNGRFRRCQVHDK